MFALRTKLHTLHTIHIHAHIGTTCLWTNSSRTYKTPKHSTNTNRFNGSIAVSPIFMLCVTWIQLKLASPPSSSSSPSSASFIFLLVAHRTSHCLMLRCLHSSRFSHYNCKCVACWHFVSDNEHFFYLSQCDFPCLPSNVCMCVCVYRWILAVLLRFNSLSRLISTTLLNMYVISAIIINFDFNTFKRHFTPWL